MLNFKLLISTASLLFKTFLTPKFLSKILEASQVEHQREVLLLLSKSKLPKKETPLETAMPLLLMALMPQLLFSFMETALTRPLTNSLPEAISKKSRDLAPQICQNYHLVPSLSGERPQLLLTDTSKFLLEVEKLPQTSLETQSLP